MSDTTAIVWHYGTSHITKFDSFYKAFVEHQSLIESGNGWMESITDSNGTIWTTHELSDLLWNGPPPKKVEP